MAKLDQSAVQVPVHRIVGQNADAHLDTLAVEEPMEIRVDFGPPDSRQQKSISVTMRTPGNDFELAAGFLFSEGIIKSPADITGMDFCGPPPPGKNQSNIVKVELHQRVRLDLMHLQRNFFSTSSCGICGKASLEALSFDGCPIPNPDSPSVHATLIGELPKLMRKSQRLFESTGGLHAAGLFDTTGKLLGLAEDVGRHNALDKLIGHRLLIEHMPWGDCILVVSGRTSFEIMQKSLAAGVPVVVAVGAPSSLAVELAERFDMTLCGFTRDGRFNIYAGQSRIVGGEK